MRGSTPVTAGTPMITPETAMGLRIIPIISMGRTTTSIALIPTIGMRMSTITAAGITATLMEPADPDAASLPLMLWLSPAFAVGSFAQSHGLE
jgi:hypothetical protein